VNTNTNSTPAQTPERPDDFAEHVGDKAIRKAQARHKDRRGSIWFGLGTFGMVGWSVAIPTLLGILVGSWLDERYAMGFSWRLTLMVIGLAIGCANAWYWVSKERSHIEAEREGRRHE
jgi:ATP synthase protein I